MNLKKPFSKSSLAEPPFCEEVGLFEDAIKAILDGSEPWKIQDLTAAISSGAFSVAEQKHLRAFADQHIHEKKKEIMRVALTKVLTGNGLEYSLDIKVATLGKDSPDRQKGVVTSSLDQYMKDKLLWQEEEMRKRMLDYQNAGQQFRNSIGAGNAVQQRIENPFSSK